MENATELASDRWKWNKYKQGEPMGTSSPACRFCCHLWFGWSHLVTFFCHEIRLAELGDSASSRLWSFIFWPKVTGRNRTTIGRNVRGPLKPPSVCDVGGDLGAGSHQPPHVSLKKS